MMFVKGVRIMWHVRNTVKLIFGQAWGEVTGIGRLRTSSGEGA
jgi:hypothetical protein